MTNRTVRWAAGAVAFAALAIYGLAVPLVRAVPLLEAVTPW